MSHAKPNVILIVLDTHRADRLGFLGYHRDTSPNLDAFANASTVYENAISPGQWTIPAHASMFSGEYPAVHQTLQSGDALNKGFLTAAEHLERLGYRATGFCNNPLVGVLDNGFRRGFQRFYNYGGTVPFTPSSYGDSPGELLPKIRRFYFRMIDRIATPIQQAVAASPKVLQIALNPWLVPLWTRYSNFKGDTESSIKDTCQYLANAGAEAGEGPHFVFLNLMETHLPYTPPKRFIQKLAPIVLDEPQAQDFIRLYNTQALKWLLPLGEPYPALEAQTLHEMYDAEVAYQDHLLNQLFSLLEQPAHRDNSLVIIAGDHGEMLGEHQIMGHGLGVHEELVHVPLVVRLPGQVEGKRVKTAVSTVNIFHTILEQAGIEHIATANGTPQTTQAHSLGNGTVLPQTIFSEAYAPFNLVLILEKYAPDLLERFRCRATRWAVYHHPYKLIRVENQADALYHYLDDPREERDLLQDSAQKTSLGEELEYFLQTATAMRSGLSHTAAENLEDEAVLDRLRKLGYME